MDTGPKQTEALQSVPPKSKIYLFLLPPAIIKKLMIYWLMTKKEEAGKKQLCPLEECVVMCESPAVGNAKLCGRL